MVEKIGGRRVIVSGDDNEIFLINVCNYRFNYWIREVNVFF